jgi:hypothetical protein
MRPELKLKLPASFAAVAKGSPRTLTLLVEDIEDAFSEPNDLEGGVEDETMDIRNASEAEKHPMMTTNPTRSISLARIMLDAGQLYFFCCEGLFTVLTCFTTTEFVMGVGDGSFPVHHSC